VASCHSTYTSARRGGPSCAPPARPTRRSAGRGAGTPCGRTRGRIREQARRDGPRLEIVRAFSIHVASASVP
jgi:hypothetical protein